MEQGSKDAYGAKQGSVYEAGPWRFLWSRAIKMPIEQNSGGVYEAGQ